MRQWLHLLAVTLGLATVACRAGSPVYKTGGGLAIKGYDPVAYFTDGKPMPGDKAFTHAWNGATWRFANAANRDRFAATPEAFAPRYGGYCAWAVAQGYTAPTDPTVWKIVDGKLYLNYNRDVATKWEADTPAMIAKGDANWPALEAEQKK